MKHLSSKGQILTTFGNAILALFVAILAISFIVILVIILNNFGFSLLPANLTNIFNAVYPQAKTYIFASALVMVGGIAFILFGVILAGTTPRVGRFLAYAGVAIIIIGLFYGELSVISVAEFSSRTIDLTANCPLTQISGEIFDVIACIVSGHKFVGSQGLEIIGYWIFGVLTPILMFYFIFYDFVKVSNVIQDTNGQIVIALALGLFAYRGFAATYLFEILTLGSLGIAIVAIDLIFAGGLFGMVGRVFGAWKGVEEAMGIVRGGRLIQREMLDLVQAAIAAARNNQAAELQAVLQEMAAYATARPHWNVAYQQALANAANPAGALPHLIELRNRITRM